MDTPSSLDSFSAVVFQDATIDTRIQFLTMDELSASDLPVQCTTIKFLTEGAANALFEMDGKDVRVNSSLDLTKFLLRLRKVANNESKILVPSYVKASDITTFIEKEIKTVFPKSAVLSSFCVYCSDPFIGKCNSLIKQAELTGTRSKKRAGIYLPERLFGLNHHDAKAKERHEGLLVEYMAPRDNSNLYLLELKPKWVKQSPTAPPNSRRCRTCAWQEFNEIDLRERYCPIGLSSGDERAVRLQIERLVGDHQQNMEMIIALTEFFYRGEGYKILTQLASLQAWFDPYGVLQVVSITGSGNVSLNTSLGHNKHDLENISKAMTTRDCSMFIEIDRTNNPKDFKIKAKLGDLDPKPPNTDKVLKWASDEQKLIDDGFYAGTNTIPSTTHDICHLAVKA